MEDLRLKDYNGYTPEPTLEDLKLELDKTAEVVGELNEVLGRMAA